MGPFPFSDCASLRKTKTDYVNESLSHIRSDTEEKKKNIYIYVYTHTHTHTHTYIHTATTNPPI